VRTTTLPASRPAPRPVFDPTPGSVAVVSQRVRRPESAAELPELTRYRGGTYSATVSTTRFADGSTARTDLVRLNPTIDAYSLDALGRVSTNPVRYRPRSSSEVGDIRARLRFQAISRVIAESYPAVGVAELSRRLRAADYPLGSANLREHEAIAATQAAIWKLTNDLDLDTRPRGVPTRATASAGGVSVPTVSMDPALGPSVTADISADSTLTIDVEFDVEFQLSVMRFDLAAPCAGDLRVRLLKEVPSGWVPIPGAMYTPSTRGPQLHRLAPLATVRETRFGKPYGHRRFRLEVSTRRRDSRRIELRNIRFDVADAQGFGNPARVVHLYEYLLSSIDERPRQSESIAVDPKQARCVDGLVGPFRYIGRRAGRITASAGGGAGLGIVDVDGIEAGADVGPGAEFYVRITPSSVPSQLVIRATAPDTNAPRVQVLLADDNSDGDDAPPRLAGLTPLAVAVPSGAAIVVELSMIVSG